MSYNVSDWYLSLGNYSFPTVFIQLRDDDKKALLAGDADSEAGQRLLGRIAYVIDHLPGASFVHADSCAPTDSKTFRDLDGGTKVARTAWRILQESEKVRNALRNDETNRIALHPYRRMDHSREFRLFVQKRELKGVSQRFLNRHHPRLEKRRDEIWTIASSLIEEVADFLPADDLVVDIYLTASGKMMILDMNAWGETTDPLLFSTWDREWSGLEVMLMPKPMRLRGDVSVSF